MSAKRLLRKDILHRRDSIACELRKSKDEAIKKSLVGLSVFQSTRFILLYASFRSEVDTLQLIPFCLHQGIRVALPKVDQEKVELFLYEIKSMDDLAAGCWGIPEPVASPAMERSVQDMDLIVVPGVAFDEQCNRLGYGKGFYDKLLYARRSPAVALSYEEQMVAHVPAEPHDMKMDIIITDKRILHLRG